MNIELFPCSGGMAEGFRRAGVVFDMAFDKDPNAVASYEHNHGHRPVQMDVNDLHRMVVAGWRPTTNAIRLLVADPPCTPWSRAGKRQGLEDERDCLGVTADLIRLLRPDAYLIGNVPGLQDSTSWHVVQDVIGGLADVGYCVRDYVSLDAADYGVPQHRVRPFWFGHLDGPCIRWPAPTHGEPTEQLAIGGHALTPWVTCRQALGHLPLEQLGRPVRMTIRPKGQDGRKNGGDDTRCSTPDAPGKVIVDKDTRKGGAILVPKTDRRWDNHPPSTLDAPAFAIKTNGERKGTGGGATLLVRKADSRHGNGYAHGDAPAPTITRNDMGEGATLTWPWDRPSTTIQGDERLSAAGHHDPKVPNSQHGPNAIILSELAAKILQGFPEDWVFSGDTKKSRWSQLGQATPPPLAHAVAMAVVEQMRATDATAGPARPTTDLAAPAPSAESGGSSVPESTGDTARTAWGSGLRDSTIATAEVEGGDEAKTVDAVEHCEAKGADRPAGGLSASPVKSAPTNEGSDDERTSEVQGGERDEVRGRDRESGDASGDQRQRGEQDVLQVHPDGTDRAPDHQPRGGGAIRPGEGDVRRLHGSDVAASSESVAADPGTGPRATVATPEVNHALTTPTPDGANQVPQPGGMNPGPAPTTTAHTTSTEASHALVQRAGRSVAPAAPRAAAPAHAAAAAPKRLTVIMADGSQYQGEVTRG